MMRLSPPPLCARLLTAGSMAAGALMGCSPEPVPDLPTQAPELALTQQDPAPTPAGPTLDDLFDRVSADVPGFADLYLEDDLLRCCSPTWAR